MGSIIMATMLISLWGGPDAPDSDPKAILDLIESLQQPITDFRCEYEGTLAFVNANDDNKEQLGKDGIYNTFNGTFIWKNNGDTYASYFNRYEPRGNIVREQLIVRTAKNEAEYYLRPNDAPIGRAIIDDPIRVNSDRTACLGQIFLIDAIKRLLTKKELHASISDGEIDGRPLKVLSFSFKNIDQLYQSFWIDLRRGGHTVRREVYARGDKMAARVDVELAHFRIGDEQVWMPVSGVGKGYSLIEDGELSLSEEPTSIEMIYIVDGTLEFNKRPAKSTFENTYKPGTPISDNLRQVEYEFGQQKTERPPTKAEAEAMLHEQLVKAEAQRQELVVYSPSGDGSGWSHGLVWFFGAAILILSLLLMVQRWRR